MRLVLLSLFVAGPAWAAPMQMTYQARLLDGVGTPLQGMQTIEVALFDGPSSPADVWRDTFSVHVDNGYVTLVLGSNDPLELDDFNTGDVWVQAAIGGSLLGARTQLLSVPHALVTRSVMAATTPSPPCDAGAVQWDTVASTLLVCDGSTWRTMATEQTSGGPPGTVITYAGETPPSGWLLCDGAAISRSTYASLFSAIGTTYGAGDGSTTFNVPDLRGRFVRGVDDMGTGAAGRDPGRALGSVQDHALGSHAHDHTLAISSSGTHDHGLSAGHSSDHNDFLAGSNNAYGIHPTYNGSASLYPNVTEDVSHSHPNSTFTGSISTTGGDETRPINVAMSYLIRH